MSLGTVLLIVAVAAAVVLGLAAVGVSYYQMTMAQFNRDSALDAARSAIHRAEAQLRSQPEWGKNRTDEFTEVCAGTRESAAQLTFSPQAGVPFSTNNLGSQSSVSGWKGESVPAEFVHLVAVGRCRGQEQTVQAWLHAPAFPWAIASNGPVRLAGGAKIAGLNAAPQPGKPVPENDLQPADLVCNGDSVYLGKGTEILGDLVSSARLDVEAGANLTVGPVGPAVPDGVWIHGAVKSGEKKPEINQVSPSDFDPAAKGLPSSSVPKERYAETYHVSDSRRRQGNVSFDSGLVMEGGLLYVDGDLDVRGGLTGNGVVVCTGKLTVEGAASLSSGSGVAVVAGGSVALTGSGSDSSYFQGLVYTDSGFSADRVSLVGPLISRGPGAVELDEARLLMPKDLLPAWTVGGGDTSVGQDSPTSVTVFRDQNGPSPNSNWIQAWVYQKHQDSKGIYYEGTLFRKEDGVVNPIPVWRRRTTGPAIDPAWALDPSTATELENKLSTPDDVDPPPPPADPSALAGAGVKFDPSQFFRLKDRMRQLLWVEN